MIDLLVQIELQIAVRVDHIAASRKDWPCRKGCDECCRNLAAEPRVSHAEWVRIALAINAHPEATSLWAAIRASIPRRCPLLDPSNGACLIYDVRPLACRAYGFYAERDRVLGCSRIEEIATNEPVVWGNHVMLESRIDELGPARSFSEWASIYEGGSRCAGLGPAT